jgi:hypothetical protein
MLSCPVTPAGDRADRYRLPPLLALRRDIDATEQRASEGPILRDVRKLLSRLRRPPLGSAPTMTGWKRNPDQSALSNPTRETSMR